MLLSRWTTQDGAHLRNVHSCPVPAGREQPGDPLALLPEARGPWPRDRWWPLELDDGLAVGSRGGHGPVRYAVTERAEGRSVTFTLTDRMPFSGWHRFDLAPGPGGTRWTHTLVVQDTAMVRTVVLPLHEAQVSLGLVRGRGQTQPRVAKVARAKLPTSSPSSSSRRNHRTASTSSPLGRRDSGSVRRASYTTET